MTLRFIIPGAPQAKQRTRQTSTGKRYTPAATREFEDRVALVARNSIGLVPPLEGPVAVDVVVVLARPKTPTRGHATYGTTQRTWCAKRPDIDNLAKSLLDGIGLAVLWKDDKQVVSLSMLKVYGAVGEEAHTEVTIQPLKGMP